MRLAPVAALIAILIVSGSAGAAARTPIHLSHPLGLAVGGRGNVFVADAGNLRVVKLRPGTGAIVGAWGAQGAGPGQFGSVPGPVPNNGPTSVAVDAKGTVYTADPVNDRIEVFSPAGVYVSSWSVAVSNFHLERLAVTVDHAGTVVAALAGSVDCTLTPDQQDLYYCPSLYLVQRRDATGNLLSQWPQTLPAPTPTQGAESYSGISVAVDQAGNTYVAASGGLLCYKSCPSETTLDKLSPAGATLTTAGTAACGGFDGSVWTSVAVGPKGGVFALGDGCKAGADVVKFSPGLRVLSRWGAPATFAHPAGIAVGPGGIVYVTDSSRNRIVVLSFRGKVTAIWE
jgi:DNA-binding beta-propeller fold protein YncE